MHPTSSEAYASAGLLSKFGSFVMAIQDDNQALAMTTCKANSQAFLDACPSGTQCKNYECKASGASCSDPHLQTTQSDCTNAGCGWYESGEAPDSVCCSDGELKCERDSNGDEYPGLGLFNSRCCDECVGESPEGWCDMSATTYYVSQETGTIPPTDGLISLCSSVGASCKTCTSVGSFAPRSIPTNEENDFTPEQQCQQFYGVCADTNGDEVNGWQDWGVHSSDPFCSGYCSGNDGNTEANDENSCITNDNVGSCSIDESSKSSCESMGDCTGGTSDGLTDSTSCTNGGGTWTQGVWTQGVWMSLVYTPAVWEDVQGDYSSASSCNAPGVSGKCYSCDIDPVKNPGYNGCVTDNSHSFTEVKDSDGNSVNEQECEDIGEKCYSCSDGTSDSATQCYGGKCSDPSRFSETDCLSVGTCSDVNGSSGKPSCDSIEGATFTSTNTWTTGTVIAAPSFTDEDSCRDNQGFWLDTTWFEASQTWDVGTLIAGIAMTGYDESGTCSLSECTECNENFPAGDFMFSAEPGSLIAEHIIRTWVSDATFIADIEAGMSAASAKAASPDYYDAFNSWLPLANIKVSAVDIAGASTQNIAFIGSGLNLLIKPENAGSITTLPCGTSVTDPDTSVTTQLPDCPNDEQGNAMTPDDLHLMIFKPVNHDTSSFVNNVVTNAITVTSGKFTVHGGDNAGTIDTTTSGAVRLSSIVNSGTVSIANSNDVLIAGIPNSGIISFSDTATTFVDVINGAQGEVTINGGSYTAYGIKNEGQISILAGDVSGEIACNDGGVITIAAGVTGTIKVASGACQGDINGEGAASVVVYENIQGFTATQTLSFAGEGITAEALESAAYPGGPLTNAIAESLSVSSTAVTVLSVTDATGRRLKGGRALANGSINVVYEVSVTDTDLLQVIESRMNAFDNEGQPDPSLASITNAVAGIAGITDASVLTAGAGAVSIPTLAPSSSPSAADTPAPSPSPSISTADTASPTSVFSGGGVRASVEAATLAGLVGVTATLLF